MSRTVTITERIRALGYEANNELSWRVGAAIRNRWEETHGELPEKDLRQKTSGRGSHCMAVYPIEWIGFIDSIIRKVAEQIHAEEARQVRLWEKKDETKPEPGDAYNRSTPVFINTQWPFEDRPSLLRFALITTHMRCNIGFTYNDIHHYCERALKRPLSVPEFDLVMRRVDEEAP